MKRASLSSLFVPEEDKKWLVKKSKQEIGSVNSVLRGLIREARLRDEKKAVKK